MVVRHNWRMSQPSLGVARPDDPIPLRNRQTCTTNPRRARYRNRSRRRTSGCAPQSGQMHPVPSRGVTREGRSSHVQLHPPGADAPGGTRVPAHRKWRVDMCWIFHPANQRRASLACQCWGSKVDEIQESSTECGSGEDVLTTDGRKIWNHTCWKGSQSMHGRHPQRRAYLHRKSAVVGRNGQTLVTSKTYSPRALDQDETR